MATFGLLRDIDESELKLMHRWRNDPSVRNNMYTRSEISWEEHLQWWKKVCESKISRYFMYELDGSPAGIVGFTSIDRINGNACWAFYAAPDAPKGCGRKIEYLALEHAFDTLGLHKLQCEVLDFNAAVINLHKKFGFSVEGILREQHLYEGRYINIYRLGLLNKEWQEKKHIMREMSCLRGVRENTVSD